VNNNTRSSTRISSARGNRAVGANVSTVCVPHLAIRLPRTPPANAQEQALGQKLPDNPAPARTQGRAHCDFGCPAARSRQQEVRDIDTSDQEHEQHGRQKHEQQLLDRSDDVRLERHQRDTGSFVDLGILLGEPTCDGLHVTVRSFQTDGWLQASDDIKAHRNLAIPKTRVHSTSRLGCTHLRGTFRFCEVYTRCRPAELTNPETDGATVDTEQNKDLIRRWIDFSNAGFVGSFDDFIAANYLGHLGAATMDRNELERLERAFYRAFPDAHHVVEDLIAQGDRVVLRTTARAGRSSRGSREPIAWSSLLLWSTAFATARLPSPGVRSISFD
jgi:hypothetical protein